jgi:hypothetical protein
MDMAADNAVTRVLAGDFNIYHPRWQSATKPQRVERLARDWVDRTDNYDYFLQSEVLKIGE